MIDLTSAINLAAVASAAILVVIYAYCAVVVVYSHPGRKRGKYARLTYKRDRNNAAILALLATVVVPVLMLGAVVLGQALTV